jgi:hypothetical protein
MPDIKMVLTTTWIDTLFSLKQQQETTTRLVDLFSARNYTSFYIISHHQIYFKKLSRQKLRAWAFTYLFPNFPPFFKLKKLANNARKVKAVALLFCSLFQKWKKGLKINEKLRL